MVVVAVYTVMIITVIISSEDDDFMGFIANMRLARNSSVIVGTVSEPKGTTSINSSSVKTMCCNGDNVSGEYAMCAIDKGSMERLSA